MKLLILLCVFGAAVASGEVRVARGLGDVADAAGGAGSSVKDAISLVRGTSQEKVSEYVPFIPKGLCKDPYDLSKVDQSKLGTVSKILTAVVDLVRGVVGGLETFLTGLYTVLIPTVRILLAGAKIKVCQPQTLLEIALWFVKELVNIQLYADLAFAQIPLCQQKKEETKPDGQPLNCWNITYKVPEDFAKPEQVKLEEQAAAAGEDGLASGATKLPDLGGPPKETSGITGPVGPKL